MLQTGMSEKYDESTDEARGGLSHELGELRDQAGKTIAMIGALSERISPILRPVPEDGESTPKELHTLRSPLGEQIADVASFVRQQQLHLGALMDAVDL